jgi:sialate O-acetylesterase
VGYFFGRNLYKDLDIPIGLIQAAWGGTIIEAWTSGPGLKEIPEFTDIVKSVVSDTTTFEESLIIIQKEKEEWPPKVEKILEDRGIFNHGFQNTDYNTNDWKTMRLPTIWEALNINIDGVVWFSKDINIPKSWEEEGLTLSLGKINDYDNTWFNGKRVGRGTAAGDLRVYNIPKSLVKIGQNRIIVQVLDLGNNGGLYGPAEKMKLSNKKDSISLVGNWKYKIDPIKIEGKEIPEIRSPNSRINRSTVLFNAMINPLVPYGMKGVIWTQGASNADRAYQYRTLFKTMIKDWRNLWGQGDFPFLYVQLANFQEVKTYPVEDEWAELREAQAMALELPNTGMVVAIDIGEEIDIHPKNKQEVGKRLAIIAKAKVYGKDIPYSGPIYKSMKIEGGKIRLQFKYTDNGLKIKGSNNLKGFAIAGKDKKFVWAEAIMEGNEVIVWSSKIKNPVAVRYAWDINPDCNLYNGADLPTVPFRTDDWEGLTYGKK